VPLLELPKQLPCYHHKSFQNKSILKRIKKKLNAPMIDLDLQ
jgi:hypothetical protein